MPGVRPTPPPHPRAVLPQLPPLLSLQRLPSLPRCHGLSSQGGVRAVAVLPHLTGAQPDGEEVPEEPAAQPEQEGSQQQARGGEGQEGPEAVVNQWFRPSFTDPLTYHSNVKEPSVQNDETATLKLCYPAIHHIEGDTIRERDSVLLRSAKGRVEQPYVAKITAFWENEEGDMMMSLLWYYRPEHSDRSRHMEDEIFASKHKDINGVGCIDDKCYVLTFFEYCR
ncbi:kinesin-3D [Cordylochernes scorpioides]|uniref:Kinesin-3D n=1 Tax=Cordylochernes scorpioides TaxID=51811 RepID=A0ABY6KHP2_9ARAC|nr:kinesin-3D [Cordylochernes scorpioides]